MKYECNFIKCLSNKYQVNLQKLYSQIILISLNKYELSLLWLFYFVHYYFVTLFFFSKEMRGKRNLKIKRNHLSINYIEFPKSFTVFKEAPSPSQKLKLLHKWQLTQPLTLFFVATRNAELLKSPTTTTTTTTTTTNNATVLTDQNDN